MRINVVIGSVTLTLAASILAGCGGGGGSSASGDYCSELKSDKAYFETLNGDNPDFSKLDEVFQRMHTLADDAPSEVADDWKTLDGAITTLENALKDAGIKPSDLASMQNGQLPPGADLQKLQELAPKLQALSGSEVSDAADAIAKNAKDTCDVDLSSS